MPMVGSDGGIIGCDNTQMVRWDPSGNVLLDTCFYGGSAPACKCPEGVSSPPCRGGNFPNSPVQIANGSIVLAFNGYPGYKGGLININSDTGAIIGSMAYLNPIGNGSYTTTNTLCVSGNRVFDITNLSSDVTKGRMYGIDVGGTPTFSVAWAHDVKGPSGASPLCTDGGVYTDAVDPSDTTKGAIYGWDQTTGNQLFACLTAGGSGCPAPPGAIIANFALDPRGGFWTFSPSPSHPLLYRRSTGSGGGAILQTIDPSHVIAGESAPTYPFSAVSMSTDGEGHNILITGLRANAGQGGSFVVAFEAETGALLWSFQIQADSMNGWAWGQFPIATNSSNGLPRVIFTTSIGGTVTNSGIYAVGQGSPAAGHRSRASRID